MQTVVTEIEECKIKLTLEFEQIESSKAYTQTIREISKEVKIDGFPKNKIPQGVIEERAGVEYIKQQAANKLVEQNLSKILQEKDIQFLTQPQFEDCNFEFNNSEKNLTIDFLIELRPNFDLPALTGQDYTVPLMDKSEFNLEKELELYSRQFADPYKVEADHEEAGLKEFDIVKMDCNGKFTDGSDMPDAELTDHVTEVAEERLAPGIFEQIQGMKVDEEKTITVDFPADYKLEKFAGKQAVYEVKIKTISRRNPVEINDELAIKAGFETLDDLKVDIEKNFENNLKQINDNRKKALILESLQDGAEYNLPEWLIDKFAKIQAHNRYHKDNPQDTGHDHGDIPVTDEDKESALKEVIPTLIIQNIAKNQNVHPTQEDLQQGMMQFYQIMQMMNPQAQMTREMYDMVSERVSINKVLEWLVEQNNIQETEETAEQITHLTKLEEKYQFLMLTLFLQK